jgi:hypothetical protein
VGSARFIPAEIWGGSDEPMRAGDHALVTARVADDQADTFLDAAQQFTFWPGGNVGHGIVYRRVFTSYGTPCPARRAAASVTAEAAKSPYTKMHDTNIVCVNC